VKIASSAIQLQLSRLTQTGLVLVCSIILARSLGPAGLGAYATLLAFAVLLQAFTSFGFEDLTLARGPLYGGDARKARSLYRMVLRIRCTMVLLLLLMGTAAWVLRVPDPLPGGRHALAFALAYSGLNSLATLGGVIQAARVQLGRSAALDATWAVGVTLTYVVLLVGHRLTVETALLTQAAWQGAVDVGYVAILFPLTMRPKMPTDLPVATGTPPRLHLALPRPFGIRDSLNFWLNGFLSITTGKTADLFAMNLASAKSAAVGRYNGAYNINLTASTVLLQGAGTMLYVNLGNVSRQSDDRLTGQAWRTTVTLGLLLSVPPLLYCVVIPGTLLSLMYGAAYTSGGAALALLAGTGLLGRTLGGGANQALLFIMHRQGRVLSVRSLSVVLNVILDLVLYHPYGITGVAAASGGCSLLIIVLEYVFANRIVRLRIPWGAAVRVIIPFLVSAFLCSQLVDEDSRKSVILAAVLGTSVLGSALLVLTRPLTASDFPASAPVHLKRVLMLAARPSSAETL
jgi:O-antigen/teichoic acid export membrane protein